MKGLVIFKGKAPTKTELAEIKELMPHLELTTKELTMPLAITTDPYYKFRAIDWNWFRALFPKEMDVKALSIMPADLKAAEIHNHLGFYSIDPDTKHDFYISRITKPDPRAIKNGFKTNFAWIFCHEFLHGSVWQNTKDRNIAASLVHQWEADGLLKEKLAEDVENWYAKREEVVNYIQILIELMKKLFLPKNIAAEEAILHPISVPHNKLITQAYGLPNPIYKLTGRHIGTDYATPVGTPIYAPWDGVVTVAGYSQTLGYHCHYWYLYKSQRYTARLLHLQKLPTAGTHQRGSIIARTGNTGLSTGPHCHLEVWKEDVDLTVINKTNWSELTLDPEEHYKI